MHLVLNSFKTLNYLCKLFLGEGGEDRMESPYKLGWFGFFFSFPFFCYRILTFHGKLNKKQPIFQADCTFCSFNGVMDESEG